MNIKKFDVYEPFSASDLCYFHLSICHLRCKECQASSLLRKLFFTNQLFVICSIRSQNWGHKNAIWFITNHLSFCLISYYLVMCKTYSFRKVIKRNSSFIGTKNKLSQYRATLCNFSSSQDPIGWHEFLIAESANHRKSFVDVVAFY